ncbi:mucin-19-like [Acipenser oxyrinchus oxyrinchus]|uniref:Mucin-19-like n=1 Tax=Acipenser oxyrinchus oxyrinchus TaxID=40147 RepID=A0AAD8G5R4_ACIOX|nr:mucin-19-like [Acipenser oxyrinchus oxyrinchus]
MKLAVIVLLSGLSLLKVLLYFILVFSGIPKGIGDIIAFDEKIGVCSTFGSGSLRTFNNNFRYLGSTCAFVFSESFETDAQFQIIIQRGEDGILAKIKITIDSIETVVENGTISVDGERISLPFDHKSIDIHKYGIYTRLRSRREFLSVLWNNQGNGIDAFWQVIKKVNILVEKTVKTLMLYQHVKVCQMTISNYLTSCSRSLTSEYIQICQMEFCNGLQDKKRVCPVFEEMARNCDIVTERTYNWRKDCSTPTCPGNQEFKDNGSAFMQTCSNPTYSDEKLISTCICPEGKILDDRLGQNKCVEKEDCTCKYDEQIYKPNSTRTELCSSCTCESGEWNCQKKDCLSRCTIEGGSFIHTFDGKEYTLHGNCKYYAAMGDNWKLIIQLSKCDSRTTCLTRVELEITGNQTITYSFTEQSIYIDEKGTNERYNSENVQFFPQSSLYIQVQTKFGMKMQIQRSPFMQLYVTLPAIAKGVTKGLCGNYNDKSDDEFMASSGIVEDSKSFATSWRRQTQECAEISPICMNTDNEKYGKEKCAYLKDPVFAKCHSHVDYTPFFEKCVSSAKCCANPVECTCVALGNYAKACAAKGLIVENWRKDDCVEICYNNQKFSYNMKACNSTCQSLSGSDFACEVEDVPVDGCGCLEKHLNSKGMCVGETQCPCYYGQTPVSLGQNEIDGHSCVCQNGKLDCQLLINCTEGKNYIKCSKYSGPTSGKTCASLNLPASDNCESGCYCQDGYYEDYNGKCVPQEECSCLFGVKSYSAGETVTSGCNNCTCIMGKWSCTEEECKGKCQLYGDGHFQTFDLKWFSYDGNCEYTLVEDYCGSNGTFRIAAESVPCCEESVTCSRAIRINYQGEEIELRDMKILGKRSNKCEAGTATSYSVHTVGLYLIITLKNGITLLWDKHTRVTIILDSKWKNKGLCGLCGNFDGDSKNDMITRGKSEVTKVLEFGNSWKVNPSCANTVNQTSPCEKHWYCNAWAERRCKIITDEIFQECHKKVDPQPYYDVCVKESCVCQLEGQYLGFCTAVAAYAEACNEVDVCITWRTPDLCRINTNNPTYNNHNYRNTNNHNYRNTNNHTDNNHNYRNTNNHNYRNTNNNNYRDTNNHYYRDTNNHNYRNTNNHNYRNTNNPTYNNHNYRNTNNHTHNNHNYRNTNNHNYRNTISHNSRNTNNPTYNNHNYRNTNNQNYRNTNNHTDKNHNYRNTNNHTHNNHNYRNTNNHNYRNTINHNSRNTNNPTYNNHNYRNTNNHNYRNTNNHTDNNHNYRNTNNKYRNTINNNYRDTNNHNYRDTNNHNYRNTNNHNYRNTNNPTYNNHNYRNTNNHTYNNHNYRNTNNHNYRNTINHNSRNTNNPTYNNHNYRNTNNHNYRNTNNHNYRNSNNNNYRNINNHNYRNTNNPTYNNHNFRNTNNHTHNNHNYRDTNNHNYRNTNNPTYNNHNFRNTNNHNYRNSNNHNYRNTNNHIHNNHTHNHNYRNTNNHNYRNTNNPTYNNHNYRNTNNHTQNNHNYRNTNNHTYNNHNYRNTNNHNYRNTHNHNYRNTNNHNYRNTHNPTYNSHNYRNTNNHTQNNHNYRNTNNHTYNNHNYRNTNNHNYRNTNNHNYRNTHNPTYNSHNYRNTNNHNYRDSNNHNYRNTHNPTYNSHNYRDTNNHTHNNQNYRNTNNHNYRNTNNPTYNNHNYRDTNNHNYRITNNHTHNNHNYRDTNNHNYRNTNNPTYNNHNYRNTNNHTDNNHNYRNTNNHTHNNHNYGDTNNHNYRDTNNHNYKNTHNPTYNNHNYRDTNIHTHNNHNYRNTNNHNYRNTNNPTYNNHNYRNTNNHTDNNHNCRNTNNHNYRNTNNYHYRNTNSHNYRNTNNHIYNNHNSRNTNIHNYRNTNNHNYRDTYNHNYRNTNNHTHDNYNYRIVHNNNKHRNNNRNNYKANCCNYDRIYIHYRTITTRAINNNRQRIM